MKLGQPLFRTVALWKSIESFKHKKRKSAQEKYRLRTVVEGLEMALEAGFVVTSEGGSALADQSNLKAQLVDMWIKI